MGKQFEWLKSFFDEDDHVLDSEGHNPSHKNLIGIALVVVFCIAFLKKVATSPDVPDIPGGWQMVFLGLLGIRALQAGATGYFKMKTNNGDSGLVDEKTPAKENVADTDQVKQFGTEGSQKAPKD